MLPIEANPVYNAAQFAVQNRYLPMRARFRDYETQLDSIFRDGHCRHMSIRGANKTRRANGALSPAQGTATEVRATIRL
jgi:hypothetical protein